jgi:hypothetical protein
MFVFEALSSSHIGRPSCFEHFLTQKKLEHRMPVASINKQTPIFLSMLDEEPPGRLPEADKDTQLVRISLT